MKYLVSVLLILVTFTVFASVSDMRWDRKHCLVCGDMLNPTDVKSMKYSIYLIDESGTKIRVNVCKRDYDSQFTQADYDKMRDKIYIAEKKWLLKNKKDPTRAEYFNKLRFVSHERR